MSAEALDDAMDHDLACWLQEAGRRDAVAKSQDPSTIQALPFQGELTGSPGTFDPVRRPLLLACLAIAGLQYFYVVVEVKILSLHSLIVFISR